VCLRQAVPAVESQPHPWSLPVHTQQEPNIQQLSLQFATLHQVSPTLADYSHHGIQYICMCNTAACSNYCRYSQMTASTTTWSQLHDPYDPASMHMHMAS
jgi:hypothetical protein